MTVQSKTRRHFDRLGQPWRNCYAEMGRMYPESEMTEYNGRWYCKEHAQLKLLRERYAIPVEIEEDAEATGADFTAEVPDTFGNTDREEA